MLQDIINKTFFSKRSIPRGLDEQEIQIFKNEVNLEMSYELPDDYLFLLSQINFPCFDCFYIYGKINSDILQNFPRLKTCDFLFMNKEMIDDDFTEDYIIFGESAFHYCTFSKIKNCYMIIDMGTSEIMDTFVSFNDMLEAFLTDAVK